MYIGGHKPEYINGVLYNNGILPYNQTTGYTLWPYNPYTGNRLIDTDTNLPVAIDDLGLARFSSDTMPWYAIVGLANDISDCTIIADTGYSVGAKTGLPGLRQFKGDINISLNLPITMEDLNSDFTLKAGFDKRNIQEWQRDIQNLPKNPKGAPYIMPLYPFNPYTGDAIIDPVTSKPVEINAADGLANFRPLPSLDTYSQGCNVDANTGLPILKNNYIGGEQKSFIPNTNIPSGYNNDILPYNPTTGYTLYPYNPYTGYRLIDKFTNLPVAIDDLGLARFSLDSRMPWYANIRPYDLIAPPCPVGARTGLPGGKITYDTSEGSYKILLGLPITIEDFNEDLTLKAGFDKTKVLRWIEDVNNLPKNPRTGLPLYPFNPYTGMAIIDPNTGKPVEINAADGLAKFSLLSPIVIGMTPEGVAITRQ